MSQIQRPYDVATIIEPNDSVKIVFLFKEPQDASYFYAAIFKDKDFSLVVIKNKEGKYSFSLTSSNSPDTIVIHTDRTEENNENIKKLTDPNYKDYTYLTCGYKNEQSQQILALKDSVPAFQ